MHAYENNLLNFSSSTGSGDHDPALQALPKKSFNDFTLFSKTLNEGSHCSWIKVSSKYWKEKY